MKQPASKQSRPRFRFISDIIAELKKVVWLSRGEAAYLTALVLIVAISVGIVLGTIDYGFAKLIDTIFVGG
jgi:preprotein translocase subunit SecE